MPFVSSILQSHSELALTSDHLGLLEEAWKQTRATREALFERGRYHQSRVLAGCHEVKLFESDLTGSHGYGLDDPGRDKLDRLFARTLGAEAAFVRNQFVSGTHALTTALFACLRPGDTLLSLTGEPYDTLAPVLGHKNGGPGSLREWGITVQVTEGVVSGAIQEQTILSCCEKWNPRVVYLQRSCGYDWIDSHRVATLARITELVKNILPDCIVLVDNCYGEFVEEQEPTAWGADLIGGSLIKNLGGQLSRTGGYVAGRADLIEKVAAHATSPGIIGKQGATLDFNRWAAQGLSLAPLLIAEALSAGVLVAYVFEQLGYDVKPRWNAPRTDIIQAIKAGDAKLQQRLCRAIQAAGFVDSRVKPEPHQQPGYRDPILMAGGSFVQGGTLELSADGPLREPYAVYIQGGFLSQMIVGVARCLGSLN